MHPNQDSWTYEYPVSSSPCLDPVTNSTSSLLEFFNLLSGAWDFLTVVLLVKTEAKKTLTTLSFSLSDVLFNALKDPYFPYSAFCCWYTCKSPTCCPWFPWCAWWSWLSLILFFFFNFMIPTYHITTMLFVHQPCVSSIHRTDGYPHPPSSFLDLFWDQTKPIGKNIFTSLRGCTSCLSLTDSDPQIRSHGHWNKAHLLMPVPRPIIDVSYQCPPSHILILSYLWKLMKTDCSEMHSWKNLKINSS